MSSMETNDERRVLTIGTFDILHYGHIDLLNTCKSLGKLTVGVNSDRFVETFKPPALMSLEERTLALNQLGFTTMPNDSPGRELIEEVKPDILAVGSDWARKDYYAQIDTPPEYFDENGIMLLYVPRKLRMSSTEIKRRINERNT